MASDRGLPGRARLLAGNSCLSLWTKLAEELGQPSSQGPWNPRTHRLRALVVSRGGRPLQAVSPYPPVYESSAEGRGLRARGGGPPRLALGQCQHSTALPSELVLGAVTRLRHGALTTHRL